MRKKAVTKLLSSVCAGILAVTTMAEPFLALAEETVEVEIVDEPDVFQEEEKEQEKTADFETDNIEVFVDDIQTMTESEKQEELITEKENEIFIDEITVESEAEIAETELDETETEKEKRYTLSAECKTEDGGQVRADVTSELGFSDDGCVSLQEDRDNIITAFESFWNGSAAAYPFAVNITVYDGNTESGSEEKTVALTFTKTLDLESAVLFRQNTDGTWSPVPYETSEDGMQIEFQTGLFGNFLLAQFEKKETESETETSSEIQVESESETESNSEMQDETKSETEVISEIQAETDSETETDSEIQTESEPETESNSEMQDKTERETEIISEIQAETDLETETDSEIQAETEPESETKPEINAENETEPGFDMKVDDETKEEKESEKLETEEETNLAEQQSPVEINLPGRFTSRLEAARTESNMEPVIIDSFKVSFASGASVESGDQIWTPSEPAAGHSFTYRIEYEMSGKFSTDAGAFRIEVPLHILKDRDGNWADTFECPYFQLSEMEEGVDNPDFVYEIDEERNIAVIYNYAPHPTGDSGYIEIAYKTTKQTFDFTDMTTSDPVTATVYATNESDTVSASANAKPVIIDTKAEISYTQKRDPDYYTKWNTAWGEEPEDAGEYVYLVWLVKSNIKKSTSPYDFILDDTFSEFEGSVVGYKFSGQQVFSQNNVLQNQTGYGDRYDFVLTRHKKELVDQILQAGERYELKNYITATVHPVDGIDADSSSSSSKGWWYEKRLHPVGNPGEGFYSEKYGVIGDYEIVDDSQDVSNYSLSEFQIGNIETMDGLRYYVYGNAKPYAWTLPDGVEGTVEDAVNGLFGKKKVDFELTDDELYLEKSEVALNYEDYDFTSLELAILMRTAVFDEGEEKFKEQAVTEYLEEDAVTVWTKDENGVWNKAALYDMRSRTFTDIDESIVDAEKTKESKLVFQSGVKGFKLTCSNAYYHTQLKAYPEITLKRTDNVLSLVGQGEDNFKTSLTNKAKYKASQEGTIIYERTMQAKDYMQKVIQDSEIKKDIIQTKNDKKDELFYVTWKVSAREKYTDETGVHSIYQQSGAFYDLLPSGTALDKESIVVSSESETLMPGEYSIDVIDNYRNSGHSMLVVKITEPTKNSYQLLYTVSYSYDAVKDYGKNLLNSVAYETGNPRIANGYPDNGGNITEKELFLDIDKESDGERFLYAESRYNVNVVVASSTGLKKQVKSIKDSKYTYSTTVNTDESYSYQIRLANDSETKSKDIVFFDSIENYFQNDSEIQTIMSDWKGSLQGVDLSNIKFKGANPKVYLSKIENLNPQSHHDLNEVIDGERVWIRYETFQNTYGLEQARAIAVDISKTEQGEDFVLAEKESVSFSIYMKSPNADMSESMTPKTYNNIYVARTAVTESEGEVYETEQFFHQDYTEVTFLVTGDVSLKKVDATDMETPVKGAVYRLTGTSDYGTEYDKSITSGRNGIIVFEEIERGTYTLVETECSPDWQINQTQYQVTITPGGETVIVGLPQKNGMFLVSDEPRIHADLKITKKDSISGLPIKDTEFRLDGMSDYGNQYLQYAVSDINGTITFSNIELGTYQLSETKTAEGYIKPSNPWTISVVEPGVAILEGGEEENGKYIITNEPYHEIRFLKSSTYGENIYLEGAKFLLSGTSDYGNQISLEAVSAPEEEGGLVVFQQLEPGDYVLKETKAPEGHELDAKQYPVKVYADGTYEITGISKTYFAGAEIYAFQNTKTTGTVCVTKKWIDEGEALSERFVPDISISTALPSKNPLGYTITYHANGGTFGNGISVQNLVYNSGNAIVSGTYTIPSSEGEIFAGWYTSAANGELVEVSNAGIPADQITSDMTLYAHWKTVTLKNGSKFKALIPSDATSVQFVYEKAPDEATLIDVDADGDGGVVGWLDGNVFKVSTQTDGVRAIANARCDYMFEGKTNLVSVDLRNLDTSKTENTIYMFKGCSNLAEINLEEFDMSSMTNIGAMFQNCKSLKHLDLSRFDTSKVTNIGELFSGCSSLVSLDLSSFDTSSISNMNNLFNGCGSLETLDISSFDTSKVTRMEGMFQNCSKLMELDVSGFNTSNVTLMYNMFYNCSKLTKLDISHFNTSKVTNMKNMFSYCRRLSELDLSSFDTHNVTDMYEMFNECGANEINVSGFDTSNVTNMANMFLGCRNVKELDVSNFVTDKVTTLRNMFAFCQVDNLDLSNFNTQNVTDIHGMFYSCQSLLSLDLSSFDTRNVTVMGDIFWGCSKLTELDLSSFDTSKVTEMYGMFYGCENLTKLNLDGFDTSKATDMRRMFYVCINLPELDISSFDTSNVTDMTAMLDGLTGLKVLKLGSSFEFKGSTNLPAPNSKSIPGADGYWYNSSGEPFLPAEIPSNVADTYYASAHLIE